MTALLRVHLDAAYLDRVLSDLLSRHQALSSEERSLATELAYGVTRLQLILDCYIEAASKRKIDRIDPPVLIALRLGIYQLRFSNRIPAYAAVNETVTLLKKYKQFATGFANAVLRQYLRWEETEFPESLLKQLQNPSIQFSMPEWIFNRFKKLSIQHSVLIDPILENLLCPASPVIRVFNKRIHREELLNNLKNQGIDASLTSFSSSGISLRKAGDLTKISGFGTHFFAQDEAAQLVCEMANQELGPTLDACAAPGGKTLALIDIGHHEITAMDVHEHRLNLVKEAIGRLELPFQVSYLLASAENPPLPHQKFKTILLDAPCTGSGTLQRHPEMKWKMKSEDIGRMAELQFKLLRGIEPLLQKEGVLIYAVCSIFEEEGEEQIAQFLNDFPNYQKEQTLNTFPHMTQMDGFYAVKLRKKS